MKLTTELKKEILDKVIDQGGLAYYIDMRELMYFICENFKLTESFIREYRKDVNWRKICTEQICDNTNFLREFADEIDWTYVAGYGRTILTQEQKKEFLNYLPKEWRNL